MKKSLPVLITIVLIGVAGYGVYLLAGKQKETQEPASEDSTSDEDQAADDTEDDTSDTADEEDSWLDPDLENDDEETEEEEVEYEMAGEGETAYTLSDLTAEPGEVEGTYDVSVKVTTEGDTEEFAQGYTYKWAVGGTTAIENIREEATEGERTHQGTLGTTRTNPTIKFIVEDPYTGKYVSIEAELQSLLGASE